MIAAFVALAGASSPNAADFTADQVRQRLASATDGKPADFARKDLSDLDLGHIDFRGATCPAPTFSPLGSFRPISRAPDWQAPT